MAGNHENLKPWKPGQSGNPGGRPKKRLIDEALEDLLERNDCEAARGVAAALLKRASKGDIRAIQLIAERTQGKPMRAIEISGPEGRAVEIAGSQSRAALNCTRFCGDEVHVAVFSLIKRRSALGDLDARIPSIARNLELADIALGNKKPQPRARLKKSR